MVSKFYQRSFTSLILGKLCLVNLERSDTDHVVTVLCVTDAAESHSFPSLLLLACKCASLCLALSQGLGNLAALQSYTRLDSQHPHSRSLCTSGYFARQEGKLSPGSFTEKILSWSLKAATFDNMPKNDDVARWIWFCLCIFLLEKYLFCQALDMLI